MVARRPELRAVPKVVVSLIVAAIWQWRLPGLGDELTMAVGPVAPLGFLGKTAALIAVLSIWRDVSRSRPSNGCCGGTHMLGTASDAAVQQLANENTALAGCNAVVTTV